MWCFCLMFVVIDFLLIFKHQGKPLGDDKNWEGFVGDQRRKENISQSSVIVSELGKYSMIVSLGPPQLL